MSQLQIADHGAVTVRRFVSRKYTPTPLAHIRCSYPATRPKSCAYTFSRFARLHEPPTSAFAPRDPEICLPTPEVGPYAPAEFNDTNGRIVGFDVDLMNAVAGVLGVMVGSVSPGAKHSRDWRLVGASVLQTDSPRYPVRVRGDLDPALSRWQWQLRGSHHPALHRLVLLTHRQSVINPVSGSADTCPRNPSRRLDLDLRVCRVSVSTVEITRSGATLRAMRQRPSVPSESSAGSTS